jgi:hypothetical protein
VAVALRVWAQAGLRVAVRRQEAVVGGLERCAPQTYGQFSAALAIRRKRSTVEDH